MKKLKKLGLLIFIISLAFLSNPAQTTFAQKIGTTAQVELMEYIYDSNSRLVEIKKAGVTLALLTYDKNGNLIKIKIVS